MIVQADFRFNIGDVVTHKTMAPPYLPAAKESQERFGEVKPQLFTVMARVFDECPGGVQKHYRCRITTASRWDGSGGVTRELFTLHEEELVPLP